MTGGRDSAGTGFVADVWRSKDGATWEDITPSDDGASFFAPRAYHAMAVQGDCMVVIGGQTFDTFYTDVWSSCDGGASWSELAANASWPERSGHALVATAASDTYCFSHACPRWVWGVGHISACGGRSNQRMSRNPRHVHAEPPVKQKCAVSSLPPGGRARARGWLLQRRVGHALVPRRRVGIGRQRRQLGPPRRGARLVRALWPAPRRGAVARRVATRCVRNSTRGATRIEAGSFSTRRT